MTQVTYAFNFNLLLKIFTKSGIIIKAKLSLNIIRNFLSLKNYNLCDIKAQ